MKATPSIIAASLLAALLAPARMSLARDVARIRHDLRATGADPDASGRTLTVVRGSDGRFDLKLRGLAGGASYEIVVDGVRVAATSTSGGGTARVRFRSRPRGGDQLLGFEPRGTHVDVRDESGEDVLEGDIPDDADPDGVRCCLAGEHDEAHCEHLTAEHCAAEGGESLGVGSCLPNPCAPPPPGDDVIRCCLHDADDDDQAECESRTPDQCSLQHGLNLGPGACDPNPCEPHPEPDTIRCCEPDDEGIECEHRTPGACAEHGGVDKGPGMCEPHLCDGEPVPDSIRCCEPHEGATVCEHRTPAECEEHDGINKGPGACEPGLCAQ
jgi:hypothetical protein